MNTAYETQIELHLRVQRTMFPVVTTVSVATNVIFAIGKFDAAHTFSIKALLVYLVLLLALHEVAKKRRDKVAAAVDGELADDPDIQLPFFDDVMPYVFAWLLWWFVTTLIYHNKIVFEHGIVAQLALMILVVSFAVAKFVLQMPSHGVWLSMLRFIVRLMTMVVVFLPTQQWAPQRVSWIATSVRVGIFFLAATCLNGMVTNYPERGNDNLVLVWWILVTPFYSSLLFLPLLFIGIFVTQTRFKIVWNSSSTTESSVLPVTAPATAATTAAPTTSPAQLAPKLTADNRLVPKPPSETRSSRSIGTVVASTSHVSDLSPPSAFHEMPAAPPRQPQPQRPPPPPRDVPQQRRVTQPSQPPISQTPPPRTPPPHNPPQKSPIVQEY